MDYLQLDQALDFFNPLAGVYILSAILLFAFAKWIFNLTTSYDLNAELHQKDNKAVSLSFTGYLLGIGIILWGLLRQESETPLLNDLTSFAIWGILGSLLLLLTQKLTDKVLLYSFSNTKELIEDKNIGPGAVEFGTYIGSALLINSALVGEDASSFITSLGLLLLYFTLSQISFILFGFLYQKTTKYDLHQEIEKDNIAAGLGFGLSLIAFAWLISSYVHKPAIESCL